MPYSFVTSLSFLFAVTSDSEDTSAGEDSSFSSVFSVVEGFYSVLSELSDDDTSVISAPNPLSLFLVSPSPPYAIGV